MSETPRRPVVILGPHRAGTSAVAGCLAAWGLDLGESIPPGRDNPTGFFEDARVLAANKALLRSMGRDWTDPPPVIDRAVDVSGLAESIAGRDRSRLWGFKDPRSLFLLPAWARVLDAFQFVGVFRPTAAIAESLARRNSFGPDFALHLARLYTGQLAHLRRQFPFPIIRFDQSRDVLAKQLAEVASQLGLDPDLARIDDFLRPTNSESTSQAEEDEQYLAEMVAGECAVTVTTSAMLSGVTSKLEQSPPTYVGVSHQIRGRAAWTRARDLVPVTGHVSYVALGGIRPELAGAPATEPPNGVPLSHIIAPDVLDVTAPDDVVSLLRHYRERVTDNAVFAVSGYVVDEDFFPEARYFRLDARLAQRREAPYLHHIDHLHAAALVAGWTVAHLGPLEGMGERSLVLFTTDPIPGAQFRPRRRLLRDLSSIETRFELSTEKFHENRTAWRERERNLSSDLQRATSKVAALEKRLREANSEKSAMAKELSRQKALAEASEKRYASTSAELRRLSEVASRYQAQYADTVSRLRSTKDSYDRLRNRRVVRAALAAARPGRPIIQFLRKLRVRGRSAAQ